MASTRYWMRWREMDGSWSYWVEITRGRYLAGGESSSVEYTTTEGFAP